MLLNTEQTLLMVPEIHSGECAHVFLVLRMIGADLYNMCNAGSAFGLSGCMCRCLFICTVIHSPWSQSVVLITLVWTLSFHLYGVWCQNCPLTLVAASERQIFNPTSLSFRNLQSCLRWCRLYWNESKCHLPCQLVICTATVFLHDEVIFALQQYI